MSQTILEMIAEGQKRRDAGMQQAIDHAEQVTEQWAVLSFNFLVQYIKEYSSGKQFQAEDFRMWCERGKRIPEPPSKRAYGGIVKQAANQGLIKKVGHSAVNNPNAHRAFATLWEIV